ncbi:hypothetical protein CRG98_010545 [Punica granatum]|uniref:Fe2OG dioxygenase domain-containing protein n=1 Tax=Punica granatum TaxID=22663 RepID=A0A2I0KMN0_PUNGR|nr:hypothetical protein CRG98_010545 [Punica granatum]
MVSDPSIVSVQELVKEPLDSIPESFIRLDQTRPHVLPSKSDHIPTIPTIDMVKILEPSDRSLNDELERLHFACSEWGIFQALPQPPGAESSFRFAFLTVLITQQLVNHGVSLSLLQKLGLEIEEFFKLPLEEKMKYKPNPGESEGYGNVMRSEKNVLDWGDRLFMAINPISLRKPHLFPELPAPLRSSLETYIKELKKIALQILRSLAICLHIDTNVIMELFEEEKEFQALRMTYYPPCPQPELVIGLTPHSDATAITILHQINCVNGLQVKRNGVWLPIDILPDAFVVNVGDIMEILSNGTYHSIEHQVMVNSESERMSLAMFFNPKLDAQVGPAASLISLKNQALFRNITMNEYVQGLFSQKMDGKSYLDRMRITSSEQAKET